MTTSPIVPAIALPEVSRGLRSTADRPRNGLPLARLTSAIATATSRTVYGLAKIDARGRAADAAVERALGWAAGARLSIRESSGLILVSPDERGVFSMTNQGHLRLPVTVRRWCGLAPGDRVLLAADAVEGLLVVYPPATLDALVTESRALMLGGDVT
jgi:bifunctional DNA-binding transcriptional regulator/antitoxin component of YhaV-PrlF toxin-antitoxin module